MRFTSLPIVNKLKWIINPLLIILGLAYPFLVYFGIERFSARWLALVLAVVWLIRALIQTNNSSNQRYIAWAVLSFCLVLVIADSQQALYWYPVLINSLMCALFALSLRYGPPVIERLARLSEPNLAPSGVRYTRTVTKVWIGFFLINGSIAAVLALYAPLTWWTLYNGFIAYIGMGLLFIGEWIVRCWVKKQHAVD